MYVSIITFTSGNTNISVMLVEFVLTHSVALQMLVVAVALQEIGDSKREELFETAAYLTVMHLCTSSLSSCA